MKFFKFHTAALIQDFRYKQQLISSFSPFLLCHQWAAGSSLQQPHAGFITPTEGAHGSRTPVDEQDPSVDILEIHLHNEVPHRRLQLSAAAANCFNSDPLTHERRRQTVADATS